MILVLVGESASGKSTLAKMLEDREPSFSKVVTYTTRPMREGEIDGIDYHFISDDMFNKLIDENFFVEYAKYRDWQYGTAINFRKDEDKVIVLTPAGARALKQYSNTVRPDLKDSVVIIYLCVDRRSRLIKILERGDNIDECYRRNLSDVGQFDAFEREADFTIHNENYTLNKEQTYTLLLELIDEARK